MPVLPTFDALCKQDNARKKAVVIHPTMILPMVSHEHLDEFIDKHILIYKDVYLYYTYSVPDLVQTLQMCLSVNFSGYLVIPAFNYFYHWLEINHSPIDLITYYLEYQREHLFLIYMEIYTTLDLKADVAFIVFDDNRLKLPIDYIYSFPFPDAEYKKRAFRMYSYGLEMR